jgi:hypothetical protein
VSEGGAAERGRGEERERERRVLAQMFVRAQANNFPPSRWRLCTPMACLVVAGGFLASGGDRDLAGRLADIKGRAGGPGRGQGWGRDGAAKGQGEGGLLPRLAATLIAWVLGGADLSFFNPQARLCLSLSLSLSTA